MRNIEEIRALFEERYGKATSIEEGRQQYADLFRDFRPSPRTTVQRKSVNNLELLEISPEGAASTRVIIHCHGGGYVSGSSQTHLHFGAALANAADAKVLLPDYARAPEAQFPVAIEEIVSLYTHLLSEGWSSKQIALSGDSAGGGLTMAALRALKDRGDNLPACLVLISAMLDLEAKGPSIKENVKKDLWNSSVDEVKLLAGLYLGSTSPKDPRANPFYANLRGMPPILLQAAEHETFRDDSIRFAERARAAGGDITLEVSPGLFHDWPLFAPILVEGQQAIERVGTFIQSHLNNA